MHEMTIPVTIGIIKRCNQFGSVVHWLVNIFCAVSADNCSKMTSAHLGQACFSGIQRSGIQNISIHYSLITIQAYRDHLVSSGDQEHASQMNGSIAFLQHTSSMVEFFNSKQATYDANDTRLQSLRSTLSYFSRGRQVFRRVMNLSRPNFGSIYKLWCWE